MAIPRIVPDSKPPMFLISVGAALLAGLIVRSLRRRHRRASTARGVEVSGTARRVAQPASTRRKTQGRPLLVASTVSTGQVAGSHAAVGEQR